MTVPLLAVPQLRRWRYIKKVFSRKLNDRVIPELTGVLYMHGAGSRKQSAVVHRYRGKIAFVAWGLASATHCGAYAVYERGKWSPAIPGCPQASITIVKSKLRIKLFNGNTFVDL